MPSLRLSDLPNGARSTVTALSPHAPQADEAMLRRLAELGFLPGEPVEVLRRGPGGREPLAVQVGETLFALRLAEAQCVEVAAP
ncbi:ferrous iron transport protein A [Rhizobacter sp. J219]|jgi:ferrous iron transport protein A|uniref:FeoA family protein n=1 Tax=Rhizobacter sp. J219 TaxID=2898430 RepID=UPI002151BE59|nr:FeoA family protein [Rhizobacter sp. J219]MCR5884398.1 ferrous iron transport protein A [Rhizobacter sp. J219]